MSEPGPNGVPSGDPVQPNPANPQPAASGQQPAPANFPQQPYVPQQPPGYVAQPNYEAPKPKKKFGFVGLIVALLVAAAGAGYYFWQSYQTDKLLAVGNCVAVSGTNFSPKIDEAKCDDASKATYKVVLVKKDGSECGDDYAEYYVTDKYNKRIAAYCMIPNFLEGKCYTGGNSAADLKMVECTDPTAKVKLVKRLDGTDGTQCPAQTEPYVISGANTTYCVGTPS